MEIKNKPFPGVFWENSFKIDGIVWKSVIKIKIQINI